MQQLGCRWWRAGKFRTFESIQFSVALRVEVTPRCLRVRAQSRRLFLTFFSGEVNEFQSFNAQKDLVESCGMHCITEYSEFYR